MRPVRFRHAAGVFVLLLFSGAAFADLPRRPSGFVSDGARVLDAASAGRLEAFLSELERATSAEVAVVTVPSLQDREVNEYAEALFRAWGIGKEGEDNGVLFLVAPEDRRARIEVGYGLEGVLPDGRAGRILDEAVLPAFRAGDLSRGLLAGAVAIAEAIAGPDEVRRIAGQAGPAAGPGSGSPAGGGGPPTIGEIITGVLFFMMLMYVGVRHPWLLLFFLMRGRGGGRGGGFGGGRFGGFGGGASGGGGAWRGW